MTEASAGGFDAFTVTTDRGPHVTMQAGVVHFGRHWTTTSRPSLKASVVRRRRRAAVTTGDGAAWTILAGPAASLDAADPASLLADPVTTWLAGGAVVRLGLSRLDQVRGYGEAGAAVPADFLPQGRVLLVTRPADRLVVAGGEVVAHGGRWRRPGPPPTPGGDGPGRWRRESVLRAVPDAVAVLAAAPGPCWLGLSTADGAVAVPATWDPATGRAETDLVPLSWLAAELPGPVCVTFDDSSSRRPDRKNGLLLRGRGHVVAVDDRHASVGLEVVRTTWWQGFRSASAEVTAT